MDNRLLRLSIMIAALCLAIGLCVWIATSFDKKEQATDQGSYWIVKYQGDSFERSKLRKVDFTAEEVAKLESIEMNKAEDAHYPLWARPSVLVRLDQQGHTSKAYTVRGGSARLVFTPLNISSDAGIIAIRESDLFNENYFLPSADFPSLVIQLKKIEETR